MSDQLSQSLGEKNDESLISCIALLSSLHCPSVKHLYPSSYSLSPNFLPSNRLKCSNSLRQLQAVVPPSCLSAAGSGAHSLTEIASLIESAADYIQALQVSGVLVLTHWWSLGLDCLTPYWCSYQLIAGIVKDVQRVCFRWVCP